MLEDHARASRARPAGLEQGQQDLRDGGGTVLHPVADRLGRRQERKGARRRIVGPLSIVGPQPRQRLHAERGRPAAAIAQLVDPAKVGQHPAVEPQGLALASQPHERVRAQDDRAAAELDDAPAEGRVVHLAKTLARALELPRQERDPPEQ